MRITVRLVVSLLVTAAVVALAFSYFQVLGEQNRLTEDLDRRAAVLAESMEETLKGLDWSEQPKRLNSLAQRFSRRERLEGFVLYDHDGVPVVHSPTLDKRLTELHDALANILSGNSPASAIDSEDGLTVKRFTFPIRDEAATRGYITLVYDASYINDRTRTIWKNNFIRFLILSVLLIATTVMVLRWSLTGPIAKLADWLKGLHSGKTAAPEGIATGNILKPLVEEMTKMARSLAAARQMASEEARLRLSAESLWTAARLREYIRQELKEKNFFVVSNREPFMHIHAGRKIEVIQPAGGLVTALDPVLRACGGTWIAHGSGDADREASDASGKLTVPPDESLYTLKRVWLTKEEEQGYYYGFSNEGLWPLCHITHTRPLFRFEDWIEYQKVNQKFATSLAEEINEDDSPLIMIQDYHFSLLPLLIKSLRPKARVALFWHIPWPNPEVFEICPWNKEILLGMLGADLLGFHTQFHCNNFLETAERLIEAKIDWESFYVQRLGQKTHVRPYPISVKFEPPHPDEDAPGRVEALREQLLKDAGVKATLVGVGVDRIDYTKGIVERFRAIERCLEKYPEFIGQFTFFELGAPSRTHIPRYRELLREVEEQVDRINWRFQSKEWKPIVFLKSHHSHETIRQYYRASDLCMVTSLHDGMNLVAKEFVAARQAEDGVLILSRFTGAARELPDALIVNPYDIEKTADALCRALKMPKEEQRERMAQMRTAVNERNIYRWAANLVTALARLRIAEKP